MTKRIISILLTLTMLFLLSACGAEKQEGGEAAQEPTLPDGEISYEVKKELYAEDYAHSDGTVLARCSFEMPRLYAYTADGTEIDSTLAATQMSESVSKAWSVLSAFNGEMDGQLAAKKTYFNEICFWAKEHYEDSLKEGLPWGTAYQDEQTIAIYRTENLVSICMRFYDFTGGAHPNGGFHTDNFDLSTGEMVTYADLAEDEDEFRRIVSDEILREIAMSGMGDGYYEDYAAYVRDLAYADICFDEQGMTVIFEEYTMGPHAVGSPTFRIPYGMIARALNERGRELLEIRPEDDVLADYYDAYRLWAYFHVTTLPLDHEAGSVKAEGGELSYYPVHYKNITTLSALRSHIEQYVTPKLADEWLAGGHYRDIDGVLCAFDADRGSDLSRGEAAYEVRLSGDGGKIVATVEEFDLEGEWDEKTGERPFKGYVTIEYPFTLRDGHAIFSSFEGIW